MLTWTLNAPQKETVTVYDGIARLTYSYTTKVELTMRAVSLSYYRQTGTLGGIVSQSQTSGPLKVDIRVPTSILSGATLPIQFEIKNVGEGRAYNAEAPEGTALDTVNVLTSSSKGALNCPSTVKIIQGRGLLSCSLTELAPGTSFEDVDASITLTYNYFVDKSFSITVLPPLVTGV
jgi:hypothetical protein